MEKGRDIPVHDSETMVRIIDALRDCEDEVRHIHQEIKPLNELPLCRSMHHIPGKMRNYIQTHDWLRKYEWRFRVGAKDFAVYMVSDETNEGEEYLKRRRMLGFLLFLEKSGGLGQGSLTVYMYETPFLKNINPAKRVQGREEINGGFTTFPSSGVPEEVVVFRREEMMKVFRHEMIHASEAALGDEDENEGYVETKATIISLLIRLIEMEVEHLHRVEKNMRGYRMSGPKYTRKKKERLGKTLRMTRRED